LPDLFGMQRETLSDDEDDEENDVSTCHLRYFFTNFLQQPQQPPACSSSGRRLVSVRRLADEKDQKVETAMAKPTIALPTTVTKPVASDQNGTHK
jgi:hypothetical protein